MGTRSRTDAVFANRAEKLILSASSLLLVPDLSTDERDAVYRARAAIRRGLNMRESIAAAPTPAEAARADDAEEQVLL